VKSERNPLTHGTRDDEWVVLIRRAAEGDQGAVAALYDATASQVFGLVLRIVGDRATAEEVMLDVYTQAWRQAGTYDPARGTPLGWLLTIARTRAIDRLRSSRRADEAREPLEAAERRPSGAANPEEATVISERRRIVRTALETLGPEQREVIELAFFSGLSHTEIAARTGLPLGTVKTRARLGMAKLSEMLRPLMAPTG
jgi:RNA polymerase sigma-70 factor (ECF subfamily)